MVFSDSGSYMNLHFKEYCNNDVLLYVSRDNLIEYLPADSA